MGFVSLHHIDKKLRDVIRAKLDIFGGKYWNKYVYEFYVFEM